MSEVLYAASNLSSRVFANPPRAVVCAVLYFVRSEQLLQISKDTTHITKNQIRLSFSSSDKGSLTINSS